MNSAYVLVTIENAKVRDKDPTKEFITDIKKLGYVKEAMGVMGAYDAILKIEYGPKSDLTLRLNEIKDMRHVTTAYTLVNVSNTAHLNDEIPYKSRKTIPDNV